MTKIHIPIEGVPAKTTRLVHLSVTQMIPMIAISLLVGFLFGRTFMLPKINPQMQIGAVLESTQKTNEEAILAATTIANDAPEADTRNRNDTKETEQNTLAQAPTPLPLPESLLRTDELDLSITDREIAITQLNEEIARVKNDSVALVSLFNTNCGNWKDECAKPYAATLEINNSTYSDLIQKVTKLQRELDQFRAEKLARL
jgi:hypothetical protein